MRRYFLIIGILLFALILSSIDLAESLSLLLKANPVFLITGLLLILLSIVVKVVKWGMIIRIQREEWDIYHWLPKGLQYFIIGFSLSILTPGRIGDFSRAMYLRKDMNTGTAISTVLVDRIIDVGMLIFLSAISLFALTAFIHVIVIPPELIFVIILLFMTGLYFLSRKQWIEVLARPFFYAIIPKKYQDNLKLSFNDMYKSLQRMEHRKGNIGWAIMLSALSWIIVVMAVFSMGLSIGISWEMLPVIFLLVPLSNLLDIVPVSISGIGTREAAFVLVLSFFGVAAETAVAFALIYFITGYITMGAAGALLLTQYPVPFDTHTGTGKE